MAPKNKINKSKTRIKTLSFISIALTAALSLIAAGCGSDDSESGATATDTETATTGILNKQLNLKMGSLISQTGGSGYIGPQITAAVEMAVDEINDSGSLITIDSQIRDTATDPTVGVEAFNALAGSGVEAIMGTTTSLVSLAVLPSAITSEVVMISPDNASPTFTTYDDKGYYFRTNPSDALHSEVLANLIIDDGNTRIGLFHRSDDYGLQLATLTGEHLREAGAEVVFVQAYDHNAPSYSAEGQKARSAGLDALVLVTFDEGVKLLTAMIENNAGPQDLNIYVTDGLGTNDLAEKLNPGDPSAVEGIKGTEPSQRPAKGEATFENRFWQYVSDNSLGARDYIYAPNTYDAVIILALAAMVAQTTDASVFKNEINDVTRGGEKCSRFKQCADLILQGKDIDYDGASGPIEFSEPGEPSVGVYDIYEYGADGTREVVQQVELEQN